MALQHFLDAANAIDFRAVQRGLISAHQGLTKQHPLIERLIIQASRGVQAIDRQVQIVPHVPQAGDGLETVSQQGSGEKRLLGGEQRLRQFHAALPQPDHGIPQQTIFQFRPPFLHRARRPKKRAASGDR